MDELKDAKYNWLIILSIILVAPLGLFFIIKYRSKWWANKVIKVVAIILTIFFGIMCIGALASLQTTNETIISNTPTFRIETKELQEKETIKYNTERRNDNTLIKGEESIITEGVDGEKTIIYEVKYKDGKEVIRNKLSEAITKEPINEVIAVGTYVAPSNSIPNTNNSSSNNSSSSQQENSNLPFKAICNDDTISYQDDPSKADYRGMCSGHGGIKTKLGRIQ